MLLAPFLWIFCEFDEKVLDNLSLDLHRCILWEYALNFQVAACTRAKASPLGRGVTKGDGEGKVARREA